MSQRLDHKKLQSQLDSEETLRLEAGDSAIAYRLSQNLVPQEVSPQRENKQLLKEIKIYFPDLEKDNNIQISKKINDLFDLVSSLIESGDFSRDSILECGYLFNDLIKKLPYDLPKIAYTKVEKVRRLLNPEIKLAVKEINSEYIENLRDELGYAKKNESYVLNYINEISELTTEFNNVLNLKPSSYDNIDLEVPLHDVFMEVKKQFKTVVVSYTLKSKYPPSIFEDFTGPLDTILEQTEVEKKLIFDVKYLYFIINNDVKVHNNRLNALTKKISIIKEILESQPNLILPIRNRFIKALDLYSSVLSQNEK